jgi:hypothetical protein
VIFDKGSHEGIKLTVHAALGALALLACGYNSIALLRRGERHLAANAVVYGALVALEVRKVGHHRG